MKTFTALFLLSLLFALATSSLLKATQVAKCVAACHNTYNVCASRVNPDVNPGAIENCAKVKSQCCRKSPCNKVC